MTPDIERLAREAGMEYDPHWFSWSVEDENIERFAALVRAQAMERCAGIAENFDLGTPEGHAIAECIRRALKG